MARTLRRFAVPVALVLLFLIASNQPARAASGEGTFRFTDWLEMLTRLWSPAGCILDPHGGCRDSDSALPHDTGCGFDRGGKCATTPIWAPGGCIIDPSGGCRNSVLPHRDAGCGLDPGGICAE
ncbi:MAG TPA: hypothetical protein VGS22_27600 [Thermoanaerobaculia bacterium]|nr:hypothetical protein [Thermoanaerobaculia bacterium]